MALLRLQSPNMGRNAGKRSSDSLRSHIVRRSLSGEFSKMDSSASTLTHKGAKEAMTGEGSRPGVETEEAKDKDEKDFEDPRRETLPSEVHRCVHSSLTWLHLQLHPGRVSLSSRGVWFLREFWVSPGRKMGVIWFWGTVQFARTAQGAWKTWKDTVLSGDTSATVADAGGSYLGAALPFHICPQSHLTAMACSLGWVQIAAFQRMGQRIMWSAVV